MADHAEFSAPELDHLEDALEGLELAPPSDAAPHLRRRLEEYRNILTLSRAAMPMVDVPRSLLDGVLAQARASCETPTLTPSVTAPPVESFWSKLRRFGVLPGVALAGTAAAVLLMVERKPQTDEAVATRSEGQVVAKAESRAKDVAAVEASPAAPGAAAEPEQAAARSGAGAAPPPPTSSAPASAPTPAPAGITRQEADEAAPTDDAVVDAQLGEEKSKSDKKMADAETPRWDIIARGDRARHRGDCKVARNEYALALADVDTRVRARAHAGLGLCDAADGDRKSADSAYTAARELDAEIVAFIDDERPRGATTTPAKAKPKAASKKAKVEPQQDNAMDPLE
jgi:hypothetical protein